MVWINAPHQRELKVNWFVNGYSVYEDKRIFFFFFYPGAELTQFSVTGSRQASDRDAYKQLSHIEPQQKHD